MQLSVKLLGKVRYHVRVTNIRTGQAWEAPHRFSEFLQLRNELIEFFAKADKKCPGCRNYEKVLQLFEFPRKHVFTSVTPVVINYRKTAFRNFIALLASHTFTTTPKCPTCSGFPFTGVRDWLTAEVAAGTSPVNAGAVVTGSPTNDAARDTMNVKDFTSYHPVSNALPVDQEGRFVGSNVPKYIPPVTTTVSPKKKKISEQRSQVKQSSPKVDQLESQLRYSDGDSSIGTSSDPQSPPSVDELVLPVPAPTTVDREEEENDVEGFSSFIESFSASIHTSEEQKLEDQPASEPPAGEDTAASRTAEKKHFKFTRVSSVRDSVEQRESSMINIDDDEEDDEVNMDFMNTVSLAPTAAK
ncbi:hypothetical protein BBO99_00000603 [Phytophthora kernoviae]|uniref:PX domain-containing protein n=2 Tax=Phytophthora kernoviae TaxID=325452 RepID=A0A3R7JC83_9STRA|nr:hypothetical protein G195_001610 [Phytophthora kernoviae 00238/432]KAG2523621.1 hypothetical protein JM16_005302 [Phytophthora kernoviae]KAG2532926.1 hypothetical protein JM18_000923 [Phytophthora kernoviae]RLN20464.1 hypothetical protein BBI17_005498 [Phytophthora kernoviae]RLN85356.1 hypothetical protein BBO99_00000603 [Phytophthora kernoviae]